MSVYRNLAKEILAQQNSQPEEITIEAANEGFVDFFKDMASNVRAAFNNSGIAKYLNSTSTGTIQTLIDSFDKKPQYSVNKSILKKIEKVELEQLNQIDCVQIENMAEYMGYHSATVIQLIKMFEEQITDIIDPLVTHIEYVFNDPAAKYLYPKLHEVDITKALKKYNSLFKEPARVKVRHDIEVSFANIYGNKKGFVDTAMNTEVLNRYMEDAPTKELIRLEERATYATKYYLENKERIDGLVSKSDIKKLASDLRKVSKQLEVYAVLMFEIKRIDANTNYNANSIKDNL